MDTEMRWLPIVKDEGNEDTYGPAVRDLQDAKDWCRDFSTDSDLEWGEDPGNGIWGAKGEYYDFEIVPMEVEV